MNVRTVTLARIQNAAVNRCASAPDAVFRAILLRHSFTLHELFRVHTAFHRKVRL